VAVAAAARRRAVEASPWRRTFERVSPMASASAALVSEIATILAAQRP
jgi:hypothetical protein